MATNSHLQLTSVWLICQKLVWYDFALFWQCLSSEHTHNTHTHLCTHAHAHIHTFTLYYYYYYYFDSRFFLAADLSWLWFNVAISLMKIIMLMWVHPLSLSLFSSLTTFRPIIKRAPQGLVKILSVFLWFRILLEK